MEDEGDSSDVILLLFKMSLSRESERRHRSPCCSMPRLIPSRIMSSITFGRNALYGSLVILTKLEVRGVENPDLKISCSSRRRRMYVQSMGSLSGEGERMGSG